MKDGRHTRQSALGALALTLAMGLGGCSDTSGFTSVSTLNPVNWFRDATGASKDDAEDQGRDSKNLAEGSDEPYPNLATVPPPPENAISKADRDKLARDLIADRQNAKYTDEQLRAGQNVSNVAPPPPETKMAAVAPPPAAPAPATAETKPVAAPVAPAPKAEPLPPPPAAANAAPAPQPAPVAEKPSASQSAGKPAPPANAAAASPPPAPPAPAPTKPKKPEVAQVSPSPSSAAPPRRGSEPPPQETSVTPPKPRPMPTGDELRRAPPPPVVEGSSVKVAKAEPQTAPTNAAAPGKRPSVSVQAAEIGFTPGPFRGRILPADRAQLAEVAKMAKQNGARVRVIGYGGAQAQGDLTQREFQSFDAALDNAKAVAVALTGLGVPPGSIDVETVASVNARDRAQVFVEY